MSFASTGLAWNIQGFREYLKSVPRPSWARSITLHHTASPSLANRPGGLTDQHIRNIRDFYKNTKGWSAGPQLFIDDRRIMGLTPINVRGVHAASFNGNSIGIEVLGNYDTEDPHSGRGYAAWCLTAEASLALLEWLGLEPTSSTVKFHRDDPRTTKTCPGRKVSKDWILEMIRNAPFVPDAVQEETEKPDLVRVVEYVAERTGGEIAKVAALLRRADDGLFYLGESWLEGAFYDATRQATVAPRSEADEAVEWVNKWLTTRSDELVPVVAFAASALGISYADAAKRLVHKSGEFRWAGEVIGGASFDKARQSTVAPKREMLRILGK